MEFGMSRRIKPKEKYARISMKEIWHNLDGAPKKKKYCGNTGYGLLSYIRLISTELHGLHGDRFRQFTNPLSAPPLPKVVPRA